MVNMQFDKVPIGTYIKDYRFFLCCRSAEYDSLFQFCPKHGDKND